MVLNFIINTKILFQDYIQLWQEKVANRILMTVCIQNIYHFTLVLTSYINYYVLYNILL